MHQAFIEELDGEVHVRYRAAGAPLKLRPLGSSGRVCQRILREAVQSQGDEGGPGVEVHPAADSVMLRLSAGLQLEMVPVGTSLTECAELLRVMLAPRDARQPLVLVVEDDIDARRTLCDLLAAWGLMAVRAEDGEQALRLAHALQPEAAVIDIGIPRLNGWSIAEHIRRDPELAGMRLFAVSGYSASGDLKRSRDAGFDEHLVKPYRSAELRRLLDSVIPPAPATP